MANLGRRGCDNEWERWSQTTRGGVWLDSAPVGISRDLMRGVSAKLIKAIKGNAASEKERELREKE